MAGDIDLSRRAFLALGATVLVAACTRDDAGTAGPADTKAGGADPPPTTSPSGSSGAVPAIDLATDPFTLGVASGDPLDDGVVIWTRLALEPLAEGGGMPQEAFRVVWEVSEDERFSKLVARGGVDASPLRAHAVHVEVDGLRPARPYWYRF
ncbi:MAG: PhoD-like phosphatase N-terminal domain-containing protein, partial [Ilumatobacteraceae bacterium]